MSVTRKSKVEAVLEWLEENAFWNSELLEVRESSLGGTGVFWKLEDDLDPDDDRLLLRIPKSSVLSPKNSYIYSMLVDYEPSEPTIDFKEGMHSIVLTFIYELALGEKSPWFAYLDSFELNSKVGAPLCLWDEKEKHALFNTEPDLLNMLDSTELIHFYLECVRFARTNEKYLRIPSVLLLKDKEMDAEKVEGKYHSKLIQFGTYVQAVISRAFTVDRYYGLSLVPGADLFNHLSPIVEDGNLVPRENVHFVCDDDEGLCEECGEYGCAHMDSELDSEDDDMEDLEELSDDDSEDEEQEGNENLDDLMETDIDLPESETESESSEDEELGGNEEDEGEDELSSDGDNESQLEPMTKITSQDIMEVEADSEAETEQDDEEVSTLSLSDDDVEDKKQTDQDGDANGIQNNENHESWDYQELAKELLDSSKCCDVVLTSPPSKDHNYELFNTYGNDLSNAYLLQRYGFVCEGNPNTTCLLSVPMFAYLKKEKMNKRKKAQLEMKINWYEEVGFELVNDLCREDFNHEPHNDHESHEDHDSEEENCCDEDDCEGCGEEETFKEPESWQLSPKIEYEGTPTDQTVALVRLLLMPFKIFFHKLAQAPSERRLAKRVDKYLLSGEILEEENNLIVLWVHARLGRYNEDKLSGERGNMIALIKAEEKAVLKRALEVLGEGN